jgi:hypothetical protein
MLERNRFNIQTKNRCVPDSLDHSQRIMGERVSTNHAQYFFAQIIKTVARINQTVGGAGFRQRLRYCIYGKITIQQVSFQVWSTKWRKIEIGTIWLMIDNDPALASLSIQPEPVTTDPTRKASGQSARVRRENQVQVCNGSANKSITNCTTNKVGILGRTVFREKLEVRDTLQDIRQVVVSYLHDNTTRRLKRD